MNVREDSIITSEASITPFAERILRKIDDTELSHCSSWVETLRISVWNSTFRAIEGILRFQNDGFSNFIRQKEREYIQAAILEWYLRAFFPNKSIHIQLASWSEDISHGIDAYCQIGKMQYAIDFTTSRKRIPEKIDFCRARNDRKWLTNKNMWIVYTPLSETVYFQDIIENHMSHIHEPNIMQEIFEAVVQSWHDPICEVYSVRTGQTPSIFLEK
jgi:hypothetical protein